MLFLQLSLVLLTRKELTTVTAIITLGANGKSPSYYHGGNKHRMYNLLVIPGLILYLYMYISKQNSILFSVTIYRS